MSYYVLSVKRGELEAASETFTKALDLAEDQNDTSAQTAIKKALEEATPIKTETL